MDKSIEFIINELKDGNADTAIEHLIEIIKFFYRKNKDDLDIKNLYNSAIINSSRLKELNGKKVNGIWIESEDVPQKNQIIQSVMEIIHKVISHTKHLNFPPIKHNGKLLNEGEFLSTNSRPKLKKSKVNSKTQNISFELIIEGDLDNFSIEKQLRTLKIIEELSSIGSLKIKSIREGSIIITFDVNAEEASVLIKLIDEGKFKKLHVKKGNILTKPKTIETSGELINEQRIKVYNIFKNIESLENIITKFFKRKILNLFFLTGPILGTAQEVRDSILIIESREKEIPRYFKNDIPIAKKYLEELLNIIKKINNINNLINDNNVRKTKDRVLVVKNKTLKSL